MSRCSTLQARTVPPVRKQTRSNRGYCACSSWQHFQAPRSESSRRTRSEMQSSGDKQSNEIDSAARKYHRRGVPIRGKMMAGRVGPMGCARDCPARPMPQSRRRRPGVPTSGLTTSGVMALEESIEGADLLGIITRYVESGARRLHRDLVQITGGSAFSRALWPGTRDGVPRGGDSDRRLGLSNRRNVRPVPGTSSAPLDFSTISIHDLDAGNTLNSSLLTNSSST